MNLTNHLQFTNAKHWALHARSLALLPGILLLMVQHSNAQMILASSSFDSGAEGWTLVNWDGTGTPLNASWNATGGNPDGCIRNGDVFGDGFWRAPASFLGDKSAAFGGSLTYDATSFIPADWSMTDVYLVGGGQTLSYRFPMNPPTTWLKFIVKLDASAGWQLGQSYTETLPSATDAQILAVLSNLTELRIREEYVWGSDNSALDNVTLFQGSPLLQALPDGPGAVQLVIRNLEPSKSYELHRHGPALQADGWSFLLSFTATNNVQVFSLPTTNSVQFYRSKSL